MDSLPPAPIPDDPSRPTDPSWAELEQHLREAGLGWEDLSSWKLAPTEEDLDPSPMFLAGAASCAVDGGQWTVDGSSAVDGGRRREEFPSPPFPSTVHRPLLERGGPP